MQLAEVLPNARSLSRADQLRLISELATELAKTDALPFRPGESYPIWSPIDAYAAAATLQSMLQAEQPPQ